MTAKEQALYALLEDQGYSHGLCVTALRILSQSKDALDDAIIFIEDNQPNEQEMIEYISGLCSPE